MSIFFVLFYHMKLIRFVFCVFPIPNCRGFIFFNWLEVLLTYTKNHFDFNLFPRFFEYPAYYVIVV